MLDMTTAAATRATADPPATDQHVQSAVKNLLALGESTQLLLQDLADLAAGPDASPALKALALRGASLLQQRRVALANLARHESEAEQRRERLLQITTAATHSLDLQSFIDPGYIYRYVNDRYLAYWACRRDQIEGHTMAELIGQDVFDDRVKPMIDKAFAGEHVSWETSVDYPGRGRRHIRATFLPAFDEQGALHGVVLRVEDVDELMQAQVELRRTVALLEQRTEEQQRFIHMISHDLREPINTICNFAGLLLEDAAPGLDDTAQRYLGFVARGGERMRSLLDGLLDYVRLEGLALQRQPVALHDLMAAVQADLALALERSRCQLSVGPLPTVSADPNLLRVLLQNLVSNAVKFHPPGVPPQVTVTDRSDAGSWCIAVQDRGIGIAAEQQGRLFGLFRRLRSRRDYEGTGLGLAICRRIAELHGGRIELQSAPGEGSTFTLVMPRVPEAE
jgi:signal transduction histidine kinase